MKKPSTEASLQKSTQAFPDLPKKQGRIQTTSSNLHLAQLSKMLAQKKESSFLQQNLKKGSPSTSPPDAVLTKKRTSSFFPSQKALEKKQAEDGCCTKHKHRFKKRKTSYPLLPSNLEGAQTMTLPQNAPGA
jgi:hypothetical protein